MPYSRRHIISNRPYILTFRVAQGLPFVALEFMKTILEGCIARTQRDNKLVICHYLWMGNHAHFIIIPKHADQAVAFYSELQKKITDSLKALLGFNKLRLWEGRPVLALVDSIEDVISQIVYLYANPARANLVSHIADYPGLSTYNLFLASLNAHETTKHEIKTHWVRADEMPRLPDPVLKFMEDRNFTHRLKKIGKGHSFEVEPNAWMSCFGITQEQEVQKINQRVMEQLQNRELEHAHTRTKEGKGVLGAKALRLQAIFKPHTPKPGSRRIYVVCADVEKRIAYIKTVRSLSNQCRELYKAAMRGLKVVWPAGMFRPPLGVTASAVLC